MILDLNKFITLGNDKFQMMIIFMFYTMLNLLLTSISYYIYIIKNDKALFLSSIYGALTGLLLQIGLGFLFGKYGVIMGMIIGISISYYFLKTTIKNEHSIR